MLNSNVYRRAINRIDHDSFNQQLADTDWNPVYGCDTTERKWNVFCETFIGQLDNVAPLRRVRNRQVTAPAVTAETQQLLQSRRATLARGDRAEYKRVNRLCRAAVRNDTRARYAGAISRGDRGGLWRVLRPVLGRKQQSCEIPRITPNALKVTIPP